MKPLLSDQKSQNMAGKHNADFRIALIGKTGTGKSCTGNTILGSVEFKTEVSFDSQTRKMKKAVQNRFGRRLLVVDTPGLYDTDEDIKNEDILKEIKKSIIYLSPGPHAIILVIKIGPFGPEDRQTANIFLTVLGKELLDYFFVIFTHADSLREKDIHDLLQSSPQKGLHELVKKCNGRYMAFNNNDINNQKQVEDLVNMIEENVKKNGGGCYTNQLFKDVEKEMKKNGIAPEQLFDETEAEEETSLAFAILQVLTAPIWGPIYLLGKGINKIFN